MTRQAEKALRDAGWEEATRSDLYPGEEFYDIRSERVCEAEGITFSYGGRNMPVLRAPRPEPEYEPGTVVWANTSDGEQAVTSVGLPGAMRWIGKSPNGLAAVYSQGVEVLRVIAYPDGSTPVESSPQHSVPRIEVIDDTGRAYVNTCAEDVKAALEQIGGDARNLQGWQVPRPRPGDSFGQCVPDIDAVNERRDARARELLERFWEKLDGKDDTK